MRWGLWIGVGLAVAMPVANAQSVDQSAAEALMKKSGCMKCHSIGA